MTGKIHEMITAGTRALIEENFLQLMEQEGFHKVSVRNLAQRTHINRGTFYLHFTDKYDLLEQLQSEILTGLEQIMVVRIVHAEMLEHYLNSAPYPPLVHIFEYLQQHGQRIGLFLGAKGEAGFPGQFKEVIRRSFYRKLEVNGVFAEHPEIPPEYLAAHSASIFLGITEEWLRSGMPYTPDELSVIYIRILFMQPELVRRS
ncbi:TetR/AcrR family transcriptional regulator [Paenibacillus tritici]|uniref:TetR/AcrR family transcriptional regulator n=1 Tax=Paenibacillus tritici TaxID=1873425 RepID=A0ABX2DSP4_9BACL|nr:TetR/AcrR family transcriptional regulator [Paenibacillus tritici]NQX47670.1 TetR/AcrR family transcriptional regulator [Paenibacillus tritici]QUL52306.1 TetR/AcrR family transcriptional regulator [Paenibacillus tritici]